MKICFSFIFYIYLKKYQHICAKTGLLHFLSMKIISLAFFVFFSFLAFSQEDSIPASGSNPITSTESGDVNSASAWEAYNRGQTKKTANKLDGAIEEFDKAIAIYPDFYQAAIARGGVKFLKYDFQGALNDYDIAIQTIEKLTQTYSTRSEIKNVLGDTKGAVEEIDALNKLKPFLAEGYYRRGSVKKFLSNKEGSCGDFNKAMDMGYPKAETSMKQYCGYVAVEGGSAGSKSGAGTKSTQSKTPVAKTDSLKNAPASNEAVPQEKK